MTVIGFPREMREPDFANSPIADSSALLPAPLSALKSILAVIDHISTLAQRSSVFLQ